MGTDALSSQYYLIALGSNQRHRRFGLPRAVVCAAFETLDRGDICLTRQSSILVSRPIGPSSRAYCNAAAIVKTRLAPPGLLRQLKTIESSFGKRRGQPWSQRVLDLDIILWSGGAYFGTDPALSIPHISMKKRGFVLQPAAEIAADWKDPITGLSVAQLYARHRTNKNRPQKALKRLDHRAERN